jgi:hypothetical protein
VTTPRSSPDADFAAHSETTYVCVHFGSATAGVDRHALSFFVGSINFVKPHRGGHRNTFLRDALDLVIVHEAYIAGSDASGRPLAP